jgi:hypothetical protein
VSALLASIFCYTVCYVLGDHYTKLLCCVGVCAFICSGVSTGGTGGRVPQNLVRGDAHVLVPQIFWTVCSFFDYTMLQEKVFGRLVLRAQLVFACSYRNSD